MAIYNELFWIVLNSINIWWYCQHILHIYGTEKRGPIFVALSPYRIIAIKDSQNSASCWCQLNNLISSNLFVFNCNLVLFIIYLMFHLQQSYSSNIIWKSSSQYYLFGFRFADGKDPVILADSEYPEFVLRLDQPVSADKFWIIFCCRYLPLFSNVILLFIFVSY